MGCAQTAQDHVTIEYTQWSDRPAEQRHVHTLATNNSKAAEHSGHDVTAPNEDRNKSIHMRMISKKLRVLTWAHSWTRCRKRRVGSPNLHKAWQRCNTESMSADSVRFISSDSARQVTIRQVRSKHKPACTHRRCARDQRRI